MWIPKWYWENINRQQRELERRIQEARQRQLILCKQTNAAAQLSLRGGFLLYRKLRKTEKGDKLRDGNRTE